MDQSGNLDLPESLKSLSAEVVFLSRAGCCLCDDAKAEMRRLQKETPFDFQEVDIDRDASLRERFNGEVPVIFIHGKKAFKYKVDAKQFLKRLESGRGM